MDSVFVYSEPTASDHLCDSASFHCDVKVWVIIIALWIVGAFKLAKCSKAEPSVRRMARQIPMSVRSIVSMVPASL